MSFKFVTEGSILAEGVSYPSPLDRVDKRDSQRPQGYELDFLPAPVVASSVGVQKSVSSAKNLELIFLLTLSGSFSKGW